ncbi:MAG TPA: hypothetical protein VFI73_13215 [Candidatus Nitrosopolaris sp.]|nr:hypothetical protein [Candidatus Nitrosopolaris sp.]
MVVSAATIIVAAVVWELTTRNRIPIIQECDANAYKVRQIVQNLERRTLRLCKYLDIHNQDPGDKSKHNRYQNKEMLIQFNRP